MVYRISTSGPQERQGIVQRLDAGTSGLMLLAKNENSYTAMKNQFRNRTVKKVYHTLVQGHIDPSEGTIDAPIGRHPREDYRFAVVADGKPSITHYQVLEFTRSASPIEGGARDWTHPSNPSSLQCLASSTGGRSCLWWRSCAGGEVRVETPLAACHRVELYSTFD